MAEYVQIVEQSKEERLVRMIERMIIASLPTLVSRLRSSDWRFYFMPSEREGLLAFFEGKDDPKVDE